jgi:hypothetical protein
VRYVGRELWGARAVENLAHAPECPLHSIAEPASTTV